MKKITLFFFTIFFCASAVKTQNISINTNGAVADNSAILDVSSISKGFLAPRMTTAQRTGIASPANGLLVFDTDTKSMWFYATSWKELGNGGSVTLPYTGSYSDFNKYFLLLIQVTAQEVSLFMVRVLQQVVAIHLANL